MITTSVNLSYERQTVPGIVPAVQGDTGRNILFKISDYEIPEDAAAYFYVQKPSGQAVYNGAEITSSSEVLVSLTAQCLAEVGDNHCWLRFTLDDEIITSFECLLQVKAFGGEEAAESTTEMSIFDEAIEQAREQIATAIDPTLTQEDMAADAKATGDAIAGVIALIALPFTNKHYLVGDFCTFQKKFYQANTDMDYSGQPIAPFIPSYWDEVTVADVLEAIAQRITAQTVTFTDQNNDGHIVVAKG